MPREQLRRLRIPSEFDQVLGRVDFEEDREGWVNAVSLELRAGQRDLERLLDQAAHREDIGEIPSIREIAVGIVGATWRCERVSQ